MEETTLKAMLDSFLEPFSNNEKVTPAQTAAVKIAFLTGAATLWGLQQERLVTEEDVSWFGKLMSPLEDEMIELYDSLPQIGI